MSDKKETITKTAQKLFARFGLNKTTVDEIAKFARIGKGTIYHYFKSKEDIFAEVIEKEARYLREQVRQAIVCKETPQEKLRAFVLTRMQCLKDLANYYSALQDEYLEHYAFIEKARAKNFHEEMSLVRSILEEGKMKGIFEIENTELASFIIVTALKGLEYTWTIETPTTNVEQNVDLMLELLCKGLEKR